jgi:hypothetical protein
VYSDEKNKAGLTGSDFWSVRPGQRTNDEDVQTLNIPATKDRNRADTVTSLFFPREYLCAHGPHHFLLIEDLSTCRSTCRSTNFPTHTYIKLGSFTNSHNCGVRHRLCPRRDSGQDG